MLEQKYGKFNCYEILGIKPDASPEQIKTAYKRESLAHHPDRGGLHENQVKVNLAYSILSDPIQRHSHDTYWKVFDYAQSKSFATQAKSTSGGQKTVHPRQSTANPSQILRGFRDRIVLEIEEERKRILGDLGNRVQKARAELEQKLSEKWLAAFLLMLGISAFGYAANYFDLNCLWILVAYWGWQFFKTILGVEVSGHTVPIFAFTKTALNEHAEKIAKASCQKDIENLQQYVSMLAFISELLARPSTFDDSEDQVARRLAVAFFLMGYLPTYYERDTRILKFADGDSNFLVRFRHRSGYPTNIAYVEKLVELMATYRASRGFVFCSPGLSGNAAEYARRQQITWYTLETMNNWIESVLISDHGGPQGDILQHLNNLRNLVASIAPAISAPRRSSRRRYRRYRY